MRSSLITSKDNKIYKLINSLKKAKYRKKNSMFVLEGKRLVYEAIERCASIVYILINEDFDDEYISDKSYDIVRIENNLFKSLQDTVTSQGIIAVCKENINEEYDFDEKTVLYLEDIQDPGNLGTIIRSAASFGVRTLILSKNSCDVYNEKVLRASMGAIFLVDVHYEDLNIINKFKEHGYKVYSTSPRGKAISYTDEKAFILMGNEGSGLTDEAFRMSDDTITIANTGRLESLNLAVASSIIIYERYLMQD